MSARHRVEPALFLALCVTGVVVSAALGVAEARREPDLVLAVVEQERSGARTDVVVEVRDRGQRPRCLDVRVAARDREAKDLADVAVGALRSTPGRTTTLRGSFTLSQRQYREELDEVRAYAVDASRC